MIKYSAPPKRQDAAMTDTEKVAEIVRRTGILEKLTKDLKFKVGDLVKSRAAGENDTYKVTHILTNWTDFACGRKFETVEWDEQYVYCVWTTNVRTGKQIVATANYFSPMETEVQQ